MSRSEEKLPQKISQHRAVNHLSFAKIETLIDTLCENDIAHPVISSDTGKLLGEIDRTIVMKSMKS